MFRETNIILNEEKIELGGGEVKGSWSSAGSAAEISRDGKGSFIFLQGDAISRESFFQKYGDEFISCG